jgi:hypothetical protein
MAGEGLKGKNAAGVDLDRAIVPRAPSSRVFVLRLLTGFLLRNSPGLQAERLAPAEKGAS